jgi:hypothetical protein
MSLAHRFVTMPRVYTLTGKGYSVLSSLGVPQQIRVRLTEEREKAHNLLFLQHTIAVTDVLIAAHLLVRTHPDIQLTRMYLERELKRKIYVEIPDKICIEPDASCEFEITVTAEGTRHTGVDFFHIEVYRNLPPVEWRFKQKIVGYVSYAVTGQHAALFHTPALSIAIIAATDTQKATLKRWTEEALTAIGQPEEGEWFFFCCLDTSSASPEELFFPLSGNNRLALPKPRSLCLNDKMALLCYMEEEHCLNLQQSQYKKRKYGRFLVDRESPSTSTLTMSSRCQKDKRGSLR